MTIRDIGSTDDSALTCQSSIPPSPGSLHSADVDWFAPSGTKVGDGNVPGFTTNRGPMVVRLKRNTGAPAEGIYSCSLENATSQFHTFFFGLYNVGGGMKFVLRLWYFHV